MITHKIEQLGYAKLLGVFETGTDEWHEARQGISGTDIGAIMGVNPYRSPYTLYMHKTGELPPITANTAMRLGSAFEEPIKRLWAEDNAGFLTVHNTGTWVSTLDDSFKANPDGIIQWSNGELGVLEIKYTRFKWDNLPEHYRLQVIWYLWVLGLKRGIVVAVAGGEMIEYPVYLDEAEIPNIIETVALFKQSLEDGYPPELDGAANTLETVRELHPDIIPGEVELPEDMAISLKIAKLNADVAEKSLNKYKAVVLDYMAGTQIATINGKQFAKLQARTGGKPYLTFTKKD